MRILIIDDDSVDRIQLKRLFSDDPEIELIEADSVMTGMSELESQYFDIVFLDYHMPQLNGAEFFYFLDQHFHEHKPIVIVLSHDSNSEVEIGCLKLGAHDFIPKEEVSDFRLRRAIHHAQVRSEMLVKALAEQTNPDQVLENKTKHLDQISNDLLSICHEITTDLNRLQSQDLNALYKDIISKASSKSTTLFMELKNIQLNQVNNECQFLKMDIKQLLTDTLGMFSGAFYVNKIKTRVETSHDFPTYLFGDALKLEFILQSILEQLMELTQYGEMAFKLDIQSASDGLDQLDLKIRVLGKSIDSRVFQNILAKPLQLELRSQSSQRGVESHMMRSRYYIHLMGGDLECHQVEENIINLVLKLPVFNS